MGATKKRRLGDLFVKGQEVTFTDEYGSETVWVQKLSPLDGEKAVRRANAVRAKYMTMQRDQHSDEFLEVLDQAMKMEDETIIEFLTTEQMARKLGPLEAELSAQDEWEKDGYLQGLHDAWADEADEETLEHLYMRYLGVEEAEPEDQKRLDEARRVYSELQRFAEYVDREAEKVRADLRKSFANKSTEQLQELIVKRLFEIQGEIGWTIEYRKAQLWLAVREPDNHKQRYFDTREEIDALSQAVLGRLIDVYSNLEVDILEGKDLLRTLDSSQPSAPAAKEETADSLQETS